MITVYAAEKEIADLINKPENRVVASLSKALQASDSIVEQIKKKFEVAIATNQNQFDLYYLYTILASVGWNQNDDVFDRQEIWAARLTPEDKPFNFEHKPSKIIGHITGSCVVDEDYNTIAEDITFEELPSKFHILTSAVIYRHIASKDKELEQETKELIASIMDGKWYVSMECLFKEFDYALITASGEHKIVKRNQDTAFLTKHLRVYGGTGEYNGNKVGRALRNLTFSGKGLVEKPANPESYIINNPPSHFNGVLASFGEKDMADTTLETKFNEAQAEIADLRKRLVAADEEKFKTEIAGLKADIAKGTAKVTALETEVANVTAAKNEALKAVETAKAEKAEVDAKLIEAAKKLEEVALASLKSSRISTLVDKGVDKAEAEKIVEKYVGATADVFNDVVELHAKLVLAGKTPPAPTPTKEELEAAAAKKAEDEAKAAAETAAAALKAAEASKEPALGVGGEVESALAGLSDVFSGMLAKGNKKNSKKEEK